MPYEWSSHPSLVDTARGCIWVEEGKRVLRDMQSSAQGGRRCERGRVPSDSSSTESGSGSDRDSGIEAGEGERDGEGSKEASQGFLEAGEEDERTEMDSREVREKIRGGKRRGQS